MSGYILVKGHGVFTTGGMGSDQGSRRALSPGEVEEHHGLGVSPFSINPDTMKRWGESGELKGKYLQKDQYTAMVDEWTRKIKKYKPDVDEATLKAELRKALNQSVVIFDSHKPVDDAHRIGEKVFLDENDPSSVNPAMVTNLRHPRYQKHARKALGNDWAPDGVNGTWHREVHPRDMKTRNHLGQILDMTASNAMHNDHGHLSETDGWFAASNIFAEVVKGLLANPNSQAYLPNVDYEKVRPSTLRGDITSPSAMHFEEMPDGSKAPLWDRRDSTTPSTQGRGRVSRYLKDHGSHGYLSAWLTLHPSFFEGMQGSPLNEAKLENSEMLLGEGADRAAVESLARSPAMAMLTHHFPRFHRDDPSKTAHSSSIFSTRSHNTQLLTSMKQALGVPLGESAGMSREEGDRATFFNHNVGHIGIEPKLGTQELSSHSSKDMAKAIVASLMVEHSQEAEQRYRDTRGKASFDRGNHMRALLRAKLPRYAPLDPNNFRWTPIEEIKRMQPVKHAPFVASPNTYHGEYVGDGQQAPPPRYANIGLLNPPQDDNIETSVDTLFDVMENLQSADARMDTLIIKSLPARRRFNLSDSYDVLSLCDTYRLDERDLHYIDQTMGDWDRIADSLKVDTRVVKAVKVALRW